MKQDTLARRLGLGVLIFYGVGDILGAGIYALVGKVAERSGADTSLAFVVSAVIAIITGISYAELAARIPHSAGACAYTAQAFRHPFPSFLVGVLVLMSGVTSASTAALSFHGYMESIMPMPGMVGAALLVVLLGVINFAGIEYSVRTNNILTAIEFLGLVVVIVLGGRYALSVHDGAELLSSLVPNFDAAAILAGVTVAFYAFIGFEDLVNLAEEAKDPVRDIPRALIAAIVISTVVYFMVVTVVLWSMSPAEAAASERPLLDVIRRAGHVVPTPLFAVVAIIAISNTALANSIMASRLLYGMARQRLLPALLTRVDASRRTPWVTILITGVMSLLLIATGSVTVLAQTTGAILILVFMFVHISVILTRRHSRQHGVFTAPQWLPHIGLLLCAILLLQFPAAVYQRIGIIVGASVALYLVLSRKKAGHDQ